ncbi:MAG: hypothetical protein HOP34_13180 [Methylococcaceae bacterium]|nr:hypothetical protein [Methylococcaceae bacterium]
MRALIDADYTYVTATLARCWLASWANFLYNCHDRYQWLFKGQPIRR